MKPLHEFTEELYRCIRCGSCTYVCPVYSVEKREMSSARGRLRLVREYLEGNLELTAKMRKYLDSCLGCGACIVSCPPQVPTDKIIRTARAHFAINKGQPLVRNILLQNVLTKPKHFTLVLDSLRIARRTGLTRLLPKVLKNKEDILPQLPKHTFRELLKGLQLKKSDKKVGFFLSCMDNDVYPKVLIAAINILEKLGYEVVIPTKVVCCGAAHDNYGDVENARKLAWQNIEAFSYAGVDVILTDCASCGSTMQSYGELFLGRKEESKALSFVSKVMDINQFLSDKLPSVSESTQTTVTYHDPCHLVRYQNVRQAPREILASAGVKFKEMAEADHCCGGGGTFNVFHYDISMKILDRKIENIKQTGASILATSCPACRIQLELGIKRHGLTIEVLHPIEVFEKSFAQREGKSK